jgi:thiamine pyrophosphokinase
MGKTIVDSAQGVSLIAGGDVTRRDLSLALARAPFLVAADGGANRAIALGEMPSAVFGDFDSLSATARDALGANRLHLIAEQQTTDFDKALRSVQAPFVIGLGCLGRRLDHSLAALNVLVRAARACLLLGGPDVVFAAPPGRTLHLEMASGERVSLFPLARVTGRSTGLQWPIDGLVMAPDTLIGTSNRVVARRVSLWFDAPGMIVILSRRHLDTSLATLVR